MICCVTIPYDKRHLKFINEIRHAMQVVGFCTGKEEIDEGGRDSQETMFRIYCFKEEEEKLIGLIDFVSLNKDASDEALLEHWKK